MRPAYATLFAVALACACRPEPVPTQGAAPRESAPGNFSEVAKNGEKITTATDRPGAAIEGGAPPSLEGVVERESAAGGVFEVTKNGEKIMTVTDRPGVVFQGGAPPPSPNDPPPKRRPFTIYAHALVPGPGVREAIEESKSTAEFLDRMKGLGYEVTPP
jgi:hypothetical protein